MAGFDPLLLIGGVAYDRITFPEISRRRHIQETKNRGPGFPRPAHLDAAGGHHLRFAYTRSAGRAWTKVINWNLRRWRASSNPTGASFRNRGGPVPGEI